MATKAHVITRAGVAASKMAVPPRHGAINEALMSMLATLPPEKLNRQARRALMRARPVNHARGKQGETTP